ncbi:MAG: trypsin-like peptidase domain-containing protein [Terracoccus sp.]
MSRSDGPSAESTPSSAQPPSPTRWRAAWLTPAFGAALAAGLVGGLLAGWAGSRVWPATSGSCDVTQVARTVLPSVVTVLARGASGAGTGSGAIATVDGVIVTNDHVITPAVSGGSIAVVLSDGTTKPAKLVGSDPKTDLAVIRVEATGLSALPLGTAAELEVGQPVVALGAPLGLSNTVTAGIVSALGREVTAPTGAGGTTVLIGSVQTDAAINPGNSGGPLVTCDGQLVGINTAISTVPNETGAAGGGSVGIGFAVPSQTVDAISRQILASGRAVHPWLGMTTADLPPQQSGRTGLFVQAVTAGGPAAAAGLRVGDVIATLGDQPASSASVARLVLTSKVGATVKIEYLRSEQQGTTTLTMAEQP